MCGMYVKRPAPRISPHTAMFRIGGPETHVCGTCHRFCGTFRRIPFHS